MALGVGLSSPAGEGQLVSVTTFVGKGREGSAHARLERLCRARGLGFGFGKWCARAGVGTAREVVSVSVLLGSRKRKEGEGIRCSRFRESSALL